MTSITLPSTLIAAYMELKSFKVDKIDVEVSQEDTPAGVRELFGTEMLDPEDPARTFDERITRCYELANHALLFGTAPSFGRLIHGSIHGADAPERIGHAWLAFHTRHGDLIWEPITARVHLKDEWYAFARARDEREYLYHIARRLTARTGHYGRWHESRYP